MKNQTKNSSKRLNCAFVDVARMLIFALRGVWVSVFCSNDRKI